jgi:TolA-binding protein
MAGRDGHRLGGWTWKRSAALAAATLVAAPAIAFAQAGSGEEVARRQLESGRSLARQGNYTEALKDFRAVADTHGTTSVADNALLEIARYYFDVVNDQREAAAAVDTILKKYPTSDAAPDAYLLAGRLALARSRQGDDLGTALANFDRVHRLFPASDAVPAALYHAAEVHYYSRRYADALSNLGRVTAEYPSSPIAADAYVASGRSLLAMGDPILAMEELQQARNRAPKSAAAAQALAQITLLHRLYVRARSGPAFTLTAETPGPARLQDGIALATTEGGAMFWATENGLGAVNAADASRVPAVARPRGIVVDASGALLANDGISLRPVSGAPLSFAVPQSNGTPRVLDKLISAVQQSNGDWLVLDQDERAIHRFTRAGAHSGAFTTGRFTRLAINAFDEVAAIDRDQRAIVLFDSAGKPLTRVPLRGTNYDLQNAEDLTFDAFGHLYVLDREALAVFTPYQVSQPPAAGAKPPAEAPSGYRTVTVLLATDKDPTGFRRGRALAVDRSGGVFIYDDRAQRILVFR